MDKEDGVRLVKRAINLQNSYFASKNIEEREKRKF